jgi:hypothetical protein
MVHAKVLRDLAQAIAAGREEMAQQPAPDELLQARLPALEAAAETVEDAG